MIGDKKLSETIEEKMISLEAENEELKKKIELLELSVSAAHKKCACYINNLKMCAQKPEE